MSPGREVREARRTPGRRPGEVGRRRPGEVGRRPGRRPGGGQEEAEEDPKEDSREDSQEDAREDFGSRSALQLPTHKPGRWLPTLPVTRVPREEEGSSKLLQLQLGKRSP